MFNANLLNTAIAIGTDYMVSGFFNITGEVRFGGALASAPGIGGGISSKKFHAGLVGLTQFFGENIRAVIQKWVPVGARAQAVEQALLGPLGNAAIIGGFYWAANNSPMIGQYINLSSDDFQPTTAALGALTSSTLSHQGTRVLYPIITGKPAAGL